MFEKYSIDNYDISENSSMAEIAKKIKATQAISGSGVYLSSSDLRIIKNILVDSNGELHESHRHLALFSNLTSFSAYFTERDRLERDLFCKENGEGFDFDFHSGMSRLFIILRDSSFTKFEFFPLPATFNCLSDYFTKGVSMWTNRKSLVCVEKCSLFNVVFICLLYWLENMRYYLESRGQNSFREAFERRVFRKDRLNHSEYRCNIAGTRVGSSPSRVVQAASYLDREELNMISNSVYWDIEHVIPLLKVPSFYTLLKLISLSSSESVNGAIRYSTSNGWTSSGLTSCLIIFRELGVIPPEFDKATASDLK